MAGYSGTPLAKKLGISDDCRVLAIRTPESVIKEIHKHAPAATFVKSASKPESIAVAIVMCSTQKQLEVDVAKAHSVLSQSGSIWVCWPKKSSGTKTDISESTLREYVLKTGLVDIKVCAVDEIWSGLKFVIRVKDRKELR